MSGNGLSQHQQCSETKDAIIRRLVDILSFVNICPVEKRQQLLGALYDSGISNEHQLKESVMGDGPDIDSVSDICMRRPQKRHVMRFLAALQP